MRGTENLRIFMTDHQRQPNWKRVISSLKPQDRIIIRDYELRHRAQLIDDILYFCRGLAMPPAISLAGDPRHAQPLKLDIHVPQWASSPLLADQLRYARHARGAVISASAHNLGEIRRAAQLGADLVLISPVFATASHPGARPLGLTRFAQLARAARQLGLRPVALGGIHVGNYRQLRAALGPYPDLAGIDGIGAIPSLYI